MTLNKIKYINQHVDCCIVKNVNFFFKTLMSIFHALKTIYKHKQKFHIKADDVVVVNQSIYKYAQNSFKKIRLVTKQNK